MLPVNGFYGHVRANDLRSLTMFAGFLVAFQLVAAVALTLPLIFLDTRHVPIFSPFAYAAKYGPPVLGLGIVLFVWSFLRHVASVRDSACFEEVDRFQERRLVDIVETMAIAAGLPLPRVGIIESPARNAFACGLSAASAYVVVTRGLLEALDDDELRAVIAHEIVHVRNGDIRLMAAANVLMHVLLLVQRRNILRITGWKSAVFAVVFTPYLILSMFTGLIGHVAMTLARVSRLLIASSREFIADAEAVRLTHVPEALISALGKIDGRSHVPWIDPRTDAMMIDGANIGALATHPTIPERIAILARHARISLPAQRHFPSQWETLTRASARPRALIQRVNSDAQENVFGLNPKARRIIKIGMCITVGMGIFGRCYFLIALTSSAPATVMRAFRTSDRQLQVDPATIATQQGTFRIHSKPRPTEPSRRVWSILDPELPGINVNHPPAPAVKRPVRPDSGVFYR